jgi:hypothetical protein
MALIGAMTMSCVVAATPADASSSDMGVHLIAGHNIGVYADYNKIDDNDKVAPNLIYNANQNLTDGIEVDCYSDNGADLDGGHGWGPFWYHTDTEYYNHLGQTMHKYGWTYAPWVDGQAAMEAGLRYCQY